MCFLQTRLIIKLVYANAIVSAYTVFGRRRHKLIKGNEIANGACSLSGSFMKTGVGKGSLLRPLLFTIYINDHEIGKV